MVHADSEAGGEEEDEEDGERRAWLGAGGKGLILSYQMNDVLVRAVIRLSLGW